MRWSKWLLLLALVATAYLVAAVPLGGRTLLDRLTGGKNNDVPATTVKPAGGQPVASVEPDSDLHTDEDREGLKRLIESRLRQEEGDGGGP